MHEEAVAKALRTRLTGLKIPGRDSQTTIQPSTKASTQTGSLPSTKPTSKPSSQPRSKTSSQPSSQPSSQTSSQPVSSQLENRKIVNLCQPFVTPRPTDTSHHKSFTKYKPEAAGTAFVPPKHTSFSLTAYRAAKDVQRK